MVTPTRTTAQRAWKSFPRKRTHLPERRKESSQLNNNLGNSEPNQTSWRVSTVTTTRKTAERTRDPISRMHTPPPERRENSLPLTNEMENHEQNETPPPIQQEQTLEDSDEDDGN